MKQNWRLILMVIAIILLWNTPVLIPLKILIVFFHELSHGVAALVTGGRIESISISPQQGGVTITRGGNLFLITSAGYIGSLLIGVLLFLVAVKNRVDRAVMFGLGAMLLVVAALYMRELFALAITVVIGAAMIASAKYLPERVNDTGLQLIGLSSMIYVPLDILSDTILRSNLRSDAYSLAQQVGGATVIWGAIWLAISLAVIWFAVKKGLIDGRNKPI